MKWKKIMTPIPEKGKLFSKKLFITAEYLYEAVSLALFKAKTINMAKSAKFLLIFNINYLQVNCTHLFRKICN